MNAQFGFTTLTNLFYFQVVYFFHKITLTASTYPLNLILGGLTTIIYLKCVVINGYILVILFRQRNFRFRKIINISKAKVDRFSRWIWVVERKSVTNCYIGVILGYINTIMCSWTNIYSSRTIRIHGKSLVCNSLYLSLRVWLCDLRFRVP